MKEKIDRNTRLSGLIFSQKAGRTSTSVECRKYFRKRFGAALQSRLTSRLSLSTRKVCSLSTALPIDTGVGGGRKKKIRVCDGMPMTMGVAEQFEHLYNG
ncbi:hypothetical protein CEXT_480311 [Caerostris extrusa]|uniref:DUF4817 domain-containing protein n=1 Tax=Caerostris extrusa TaxID=172846 RepID=A0AAV4XGI2_CAEEX|nr:hypothetical protein CEXT_480311 [Caerostris extrusa]